MDIPFTKLHVGGTASTLKKCECISEYRQDNILHHYFPLMEGLVRAELQLKSLCLVWCSLHRGCTAQV